MKMWIYAVSGGRSWYNELFGQKLLIEQSRLANLAFLLEIHIGSTPLLCKSGIFEGFSIFLACKNSISVFRGRPTGKIPTLTIPILSKSENQRNKLLLTTNEALLVAVFDLSHSKILRLSPSRTISFLVAILSSP